MDISEENDSFSPFPIDDNLEKSSEIADNAFASLRDSSASHGNNSMEEIESLGNADILVDANVNSIDTNTKKSIQNEFHVSLPKNNISIHTSPIQFSYMKFPKYMNIESTPYDPSSFKLYELQKYDEDEDVTISRLAATIRWRNQPSAAPPQPSSDDVGSTFNPINGMNRVSNSHFVQWSDNSWSLVIGKEVFDINHLPVDKLHKYIYAHYPTKDIFEEVGRINETLSIKATHTSNRKWSKVSESRLKLTVTKENPLKKWDEERSVLAEKQKMADKKKTKQKSFQNAFYRGITKSFLEDDDEESPESSRERSKGLTYRNKPSKSRGPSQDDEDEKDEYDELEEDDASFIEDDDSEVENSSKSIDDSSGGSYDSEDESQGDSENEKETDRSSADEDAVERIPSPSSTTPKTRVKSILESDDE